MEQGAVTKRRKRVVKMGCVSYAQLIKYMLEGIYDCQELAELTGLSYVCVCQYTRELHRAGVAYIASWERESNRERFMRKVYKLGEGSDVERPRMSRAETDARYRARKEMQTTLHRMAGKL